MQSNIKHLDLFLIHHQSFASSKESYRRNIVLWFKWLEQKKIYNPDYSDLLQYKDELQKKSLSPRTQANYLTSIKLFYRFLEEQKLGRNIAQNLKTSIGSKSQLQFHKDALSIEQVLSFLEQIDTSEPEGLRDFAILNLLVRTGLRTIEITRAKIGDIRQKDGKNLLWVQGKGRQSKDEFIVLSKEAYSPIQKYLKSRGIQQQDQPLFTSLSFRNLNEALTTRSIRRIAKKYLRAIDLDSPRFSAHSLRHTAVTLALKAGSPIRQVQGMARHKSVTTTEIYAHDIERLHNSAEEQISRILPLPKAS